MGSIGVSPLRAGSQGASTPAGPFTLYLVAKHLALQMQAVCCIFVATYERGMVAVTAT
jgi:hypothetical protein